MCSTDVKSGTEFYAKLYPEKSSDGVSFDKRRNAQEPRRTARRWCCRFAVLLTDTILRSAGSTSG